MSQLTDVFGSLFELGNALAKSHSMGVKRSPTNEHRLFVVLEHKLEPGGHPPLLLPQFLTLCAYPDKDQSGLPKIIIEIAKREEHINQRRDGFALTDPATIATYTANGLTHTQANEVFTRFATFEPTEATPQRAFGETCHLSEKLGTQEKIHINGRYVIPHFFDVR